MVPHKTPLIFQKLMPSRLWRMPEFEKKLYLTFDDGPIPGLTDWVLEVLKVRNAKATFFCVGENIERHPQLFQRLITEGHSVGNHTQHHLNGWQTPLEDYVANVEQCRSAMTRQGQNTRLFRPPYGRLRWQQKKKLADFQVVMWDLLSKDYLQTLSPEMVLQESIFATQPGSIIVFHENRKAELNLKYALPRYMDHFERLGFEFEKLPQ